MSCNKGFNESQAIESRRVSFRHRMLLLAMDLLVVVYLGWRSGSGIGEESRRRGGAG
ncbi:hypothetical protein DsansV1_C23g0178871 [Dioscorea sansibarensis]